MLVICVAVNFWGCTVTYNSEYMAVTEPIANEKFRTFVREQKATIKKFLKTHTIADFLMQNPIDFVGYKETDVGSDGNLYTIKVRPTIPRVRNMAVNSYGSFKEVREHTEIRYTLHVNADGILKEEIKVEFEVYDTKAVDELSEDEKQLRQKNATTDALLTLLVIAGVLTVLIAFSDGSPN